MAKRLSRITWVFMCSIQTVFVVHGISGDCRGHPGSSEVNVPKCGVGGPPRSDIETHLEEIVETYL